MRPSFNLDGNGRPKLLLPGEKQVIPSASAPPPIQILVGNDGQRVVLAVKIGDKLLPLPMTEDQALHHAELVLNAIRQLREARCLSESHPTGLPDSKPPQDTGIMTGMPGTESRPGSTQEPCGASCEDSSY